MPTDDKRERKLLMTLCIVLIAIMVIGEVCTYTMSYRDYDATASVEDDLINYSISASGSKQYSVIVSENDGYVPVKRLHLYYDTSYPSNTRVVNQADGQSEIEKHFLDQLTKHLETLGVTEVDYCDADQIVSTMLSELDNGDCYGTGMVCVSGILPDTIYSGSETDPLIRWMSAGGTMYWALGILGEYYGTADGTVVPVEGYEELFFSGNSGCINKDDGPSKAFHDIEGYREALCLVNNGLLGSVITSKLEGIQYLKLGYEDLESQCVSNTIVQYGKGAFAVIGGGYALNQIYDMAQIIGSGVGPGSEIIEVIEGTVTRGTIEGSILANEKDRNVYIFLGGYLSVYGKCFYFPSEDYSDEHE